MPLFLVAEPLSRRRRQYNGYGYPQQYGPGGQGWVNNEMNMNNRYPNQPGSNWNNNLNWNQANRHPEWYYNTSPTIQSSFLCILLLVVVSVFLA